MRILWLKTELLHPVDKGGKIRTYQMLKALKAEHHVTYLTLDDGSAPAEAAGLSSEYCHELVTIEHRTAAKFSARFYLELLANQTSSLPYALQKYRSRRMASEIRRRAGGGAFDLVVCDFLTPGVNVPERLPTVTVLFQHNVEAMIWRRHWEVARNPLKKAFMHRQWRLTEQFEREFCRRVDGVVTVSADDTRTITEQYGVEGVEDVPTGVDTEFFRPSGAEPRRSRNIVFTGSMDWLPNDDAIRFFLDQVLPLIRQRMADVTVTIVGRSPLAWLRERAQRDTAIEVTGRVEDVRPYLERAAAYVVPIRIGGGTRLKIYEGMAMECPMVSTTIGAEGLPLVDGREIVIADSVEDFAAAVVRLLSDVPFARALAAHAADRVRRDFAWQRVAARFGEICSAVVERAGRPPVVVAGG